MRKSTNNVLKLSVAAAVAVTLFALACACSVTEPDTELSNSVDTTDTATVTATTSPEIPTANATLPPKLTATPTKTHTPRPSPTLSPTPTATSEPINHASLGWQDYDPAIRPKFQGEEQIIQLLANLIQEYVDAEASYEDIQVAWLQIGDEGYWRPYYTSEDGDEITVHFLSPVAAPSGEMEALPNVHGCYPTFSISISRLIERGWIDSVTDIRLMSNEQNGEVKFGIESTATSHLWFDEEICNRLTSTDNLPGFGLPGQPETEVMSILVIDAMTGEAFLFQHDEQGTSPAGIAEPTNGPTHQLVQGQWHQIEETDFVGGTQPWVAFIGVKEDGEASLYLSNWSTNLQTALPIQRTSWTDDVVAVSPAAHTSSSSELWGIAHGVVDRPRWSPDGLLIAFNGLNDGQPSVSVYDLESGLTTHLATIPLATSFSYGPVWSPDGKWLLYGYGSTCNAANYIVSYPSGEVRYIGHGSGAFWVSNEDELAVGYHPNCYSNQLSVTNVDGTPSQLASDLDLYGFVKGYAHRSMAFLVQRGSSDGSSQDFVLVPLDGSESRTLYSIQATSDIYYDEVLLSPLEDWLAYRIPGACHIIIDLKEQERVWMDDMNCPSVSTWTADGRGFIKYRFNIEVGDPAHGKVVYFIPGMEEKIYVADTNHIIHHASDVYFDNSLLSNP